MAPYSQKPQFSETESHGRRAVEYRGKLFGGIEELPVDERYKHIMFDLESSFAHLLRRRFNRDPTAYEAYMFAVTEAANMRMLITVQDTIIGRLEELSAQVSQENEALRKRLDKIESDLFEED